jgi:hypothetical protein
MVKKIIKEISQAADLKLRLGENPPKEIPVPTNSGRQ